MDTEEMTVDSNVVHLPICPECNKVQTLVCEPDCTDNESYLYWECACNRSENEESQE